MAVTVSNCYNGDAVKRVVSRDIRADGAGSVGAGVCDSCVVLVLVIVVLCWCW